MTHHASLAELYAADLREIDAAARRFAWGLWPQGNGTEPLAGPMLP